ncbi:hypothetical protein ACGFI9_09610 [Micromonospora sp. NPDC048930]|uniref:hypothetical protein n=1 Tax=Micromonospora sp. NPDC048930 TaxID=3364261 RepID=UPI00371BDB42
MPVSGKSHAFVWTLAPTGAAVVLLAQLIAASRIGLLPFDRSFAAGADGEWLTLMATVTGLAAITSTLGGLVASRLLSGTPARLGLVMLVAAAGLSSAPYLRRLAADAHDVSLAIGGPANSVTVALAIGLALGAVTATAIRLPDRRPVTAGLLVTAAGIWALAAASTHLAVAVPPLGLPTDQFRTQHMAHLGGWFPLPAALWMLIGAASAFAARSRAASRSAVLISGVLGAFLVSLSYFTAWPSEPYGDHITVQSQGLAYATMLVGGALFGSVPASVGLTPPESRAAQAGP